MDKVTDYRLVHCPYNEAAFRAAVLALIAAGWQPLGGVAVNFSDAGHVIGWTQAMVRYGRRGPLSPLPIRPGQPPGGSTRRTAKPKTLDLSTED